MTTRGKGEKALSLFLTSKETDRQIETNKQTLRNIKQTNRMTSKLCECSDSGPRRKTGPKYSPDRGFPRGFQVKWRVL